MGGGKHNCKVKIECPPCNAKDQEGFKCTRRKGHRGAHHAHAGEGRCCAVWQDPTTPDTPEKALTDLGAIIDRLAAFDPRDYPVGTHIVNMPKKRRMDCALTGMIEIVLNLDERLLWVRTGTKKEAQKEADAQKGAHQ